MPTILSSMTILLLSSIIYTSVLAQIETTVMPSSALNGASNTLVPTVISISNETSLNDLNVTVHEEIPTSTPKTSTSSVTLSLALFQSIVLISFLL